jgi:hypothetical protein
MGNVRRTKAEISTSGLEVVPERGSGEGKQKRVRSRRGDKHPDQFLDNRIVDHHRLILASLGDAKAERHVGKVGSDAGVFGVGHILDAQANDLTDAEQAIEPEKNSDGEAIVTVDGEAKGDEAGELPSERRVGFGRLQLAPAHQ